MNDVEKIYEISKSTFWKYIRWYYFVAIFIGILGTLIFAYDILFIGGFILFDIFAIIILWAVMSIAVYWLVLEYNQFGIYKDGFYPPRKRRKFKNNPKRLFVPYNSIERVEIEGKSFPRAPFFFEIALKNGEMVKFDVGDLMPFMKSNEKELKMIFDLLIEMTKQVEKAKKEKREIIKINAHPLYELVDKYNASISG